MTSAREWRMRGSDVSGDDNSPMSYFLTLYDADGASELQHKQAEQRFRMALEQALGDENLGARRPIRRLPGRCVLPAPPAPTATRQSSSERLAPLRTDAAWLHVADVA